MHFCYLLGKPLNERDAKRFGIQLLVSKGVKITTIDISSIIYPWVRRNQAVSFSVEGVESLIASDAKSLKKHLYSVSPISLTIFFHAFSGVTLQNISVLRCISAMAVPYLIVRPPTYPGMGGNRFWRREGGKIFNLLRLALRKNWLNTVVRLLPIELLGIRGADFVLNCAPGLKISATLKTENSRIIAGHSYDYDLYLEAKNNSIPQKDTVVFIDQNIPFHPDMTESQNIVRVDPVRYYAQVENFLDQIAQNYGLEIVIAAHPSANFASHPSILKGRKIVYNDTANQIFQSKLVVAQSSTAVGLAVASNKPISLIWSREFADFGTEKYMSEKLSRALNTSHFHIDNPETWDLDSIFEVDRACYERYHNRYLGDTSAAEELLWKRVLNVIRSELDNTTD